MESIFEALSALLGLIVFLVVPLVFIWMTIHCEVERINAIRKRQIDELKQELIAALKQELESLKEKK